MDGWLVGLGVGGQWLVDTGIRCGWTMVGG